MSVEFIITKHQYDKEMKTPHLSTHETEYATMKARFFMTLVEKWGMVVAADAGEDSGGRQKSKEMPVSEVIKRAADITEEAWTLMAERSDMLVTMPTISEMREIVKAREQEKETEPAL